MGELRRLIRHKSPLRGRVYFNDRRDSADCQIRDISAEGARIAFTADVAVPDVVDLYLPHKEQTVCACVEWRRGSELGLSFCNDARAPGAPLTSGDLALRVAQLEFELASLRRTVKRLTGKGEK